MMEARFTMLVDGDRPSTGALVAQLKGTPFSPTAIAATVEDAGSLLRRGMRPDLILAVLPDGAVDAFGEPLRQLRAAAPDARLVVLGDAFAEPLLALALRVGAAGCLDRRIGAHALQRALALVCLGMTVMPDAVSEVLDSVTDSSVPPDAADAGELSRREIEILQCLLAGQSNKAIARELDITESTVKMHFKNLMRKIRAQNRTQAAVWAIQRGLAGPREDAPALRARVAR
ncbi:LuxR C-terminal-related transcriptional regulator [Arenibaculum pallidiluteum]|uniref:LuxR C-terminal-related transcriptional regulator n=1 Tax=Arenibaculum pallidiluteum TaxID=2812559 RepID=UPI001F3287F9|nr:response regulator transcription factor [Arenibaculum pallidiluteum]